MKKNGNIRIKKIRKSKIEVKAREINFDISFLDYLLVNYLFGYSFFQMLLFFLKSFNFYLHIIFFTLIVFVDS